MPAEWGVVAGVEGTHNLKSSYYEEHLGFIVNEQVSPSSQCDAMAKRLVQSYV